MDLPFEEVAENYRELARVNRLLLFADPFTRQLAGWLGREQCRSLSILDLGAGDGSLGRAITAWAEKRGWTWTITNLDFNPRALRLHPSPRNVVASVLSLPFPDHSFDVVIASQMTHHMMREEEVVTHWREAWRVTRQAIFICDIHRNAGVYGGLWLLMRALGLSKNMFNDGLLSVRRGWRLGEWKQLARQAGLDPAGVRLSYGSRIILQARKTSGLPPNPPL